MEPSSVLQNLVASLVTCREQLDDPDTKRLLHVALHNNDALPDKKVFDLASDALNLLKDIQLSLEQGPLILADHFLGIFIRTHLSQRIHNIRKGYTNTKCLVAAVNLKLPDILSSGPLTLSSLAERSEARPDRLGQIMRTLYSNGIFICNESNGTYNNNHVSELLRSDHRTQWRAWVNLYGNEFYDMARGIPGSIAKNAIRTPAQLEYSTDDSMFDYFTERGWIEKLHQTLGASAIAQAPGILEDYPWAELSGKTIIDIGGGGGALIALLMRKCKTLQGGILDRSEVIEQASRNFHAPGGQFSDVAKQVPAENLIVGDFMMEVPHSEIYTIKWCLHDWDDEKASTILRNIRRAINRGSQSRLVILESILNNTHAGRLSRYADMNMMIAVGGQERTEEQWRRLAVRTGWRVERICPLRSAWPSAIEFVPLWRSPDDVVAEMRFLEPWDASRGNPYIRVDPVKGFPRMNFQWRDYPVKIRDARPIKGQFSLDIHGFQYVDADISQEVRAALRGNDRKIVEDNYYPHVRDLVKRITGAARVIIFDHTFRKPRAGLSKTKNSNGKEQPALMVHCDQSEKGALRRLRMNKMDEEDIEDLLKGRVQMLNIWRPLNDVVENWPLATMSYSTTAVSSMYPCDLLRGEFEDRGQTATFTYDETQEWFYLNLQQYNEVTVIKIWDSQNSGSKFCAHAAFNLQLAPTNVEPRESIEVRCLVIHEPGAL